MPTNPDRSARSARTVLRTTVVGAALCALAAGCTVPPEPASPSDPGWSSTAGTPSAQPSGPAAVTSTAGPGTEATSAPAAEGPLPQASGSPSTGPTAPGGGCTPDRALAALTPEQRAGQLVMVGVPVDGGSAEARRQVARLHVGNVMLTGRTTARADDVARTPEALQQLARTDRAATGGVGLWVSTDQEGGQVRVLRGPDFADMPTALVQSTWDAARIERRAAEWGRALKASGVNLNLAPTVDLVPRGLGRANAPIGAFDRQLGWDVETITRSSTAFVRGMRASGVGSTAKHFPGLGAVRDNTDTTPVVVDSVTGPDAASLEPYRALAREGVPLVMVSSARYDRIDEGVPALFSRKVHQLLRSTGFDGVVITDDTGNAKALASVGAAETARRAVAAGVDVVLTVDPADAEPMTSSLVRRSRDDAGFRARVDDAALRVLRAKAAQGLLPPTC